MIQTLYQVVERKRVDAYILKNWKMKKIVNSKDTVHPLYDCDRDTFVYFQTTYGARMINDVFVNMYVTPETFAAIRDVYNFKYYTVFSLYNILLTAPDEIDSLPNDIDMHDYVNDFNILVDRLGTGHANMDTVLKVIDIVTIRTLDRARISICKHMFKSCVRMPDTVKFELMHHCFKNHRVYFDSEWDEIFIYMCRIAVSRICRETFETLPIDDIMTFVLSHRFTRDTAVELLLRVSAKSPIYTTASEFDFIYAVQMKIPEFYKEHYAFVVMIGRLLCHMMLTSSPREIDPGDFMNKITRANAMDILVSKYYTGPMFTSMLINVAIPRIDDETPTQLADGMINGVIGVVLCGNISEGLTFTAHKAIAVENILHNIFTMKHSAGSTTISREKAAVVVNGIQQYLQCQVDIDRHVKEYFSIFLKLFMINSKNYKWIINEISPRLNAMPDETMIQINIDRCIYALKNDVKMDQKTVLDVVKYTVRFERIVTIFESRLPHIFFSQ